MVTCACGGVVYIKSRGLCQRCYNREWWAANATPEKREAYNHAARAKRYMTEDGPSCPIDVGYHGAHLRIDKARGQADTHECVECGEQASDWAYKGGGVREVRGEREPGVKATWSTNPLDYQPMCRTCHVEMDRPRMDPAERRRKQAEWTQAWQARQPADYKQRKQAERLASITAVCACGSRVHYVKTGECAPCYARRRYLARKAGRWNPAGQRMPNW